MFWAEIRPGVDFVKESEAFLGKSDRVMMALAMAAEVHKEDRRKTTGEPYLNHCVAVASILEAWGADEDEIVAGLLHDTVEDHADDLNLDTITLYFGERVAHLVSGVTKFGSDFETLKKVTSESLIEPGVALIKLADRLHNMLTMEKMPPSSQRKNAKETLDVYAPLAESFGMWQVKNYLADIAFSYTDPRRFSEVKELIDNDPRLKADFMERETLELEQVLKGAGLNVVVEHQVGGYYELAEKQRMTVLREDGRPRSFEEITDVVSFRVLVDKEEDLADCYLAMGLLRLYYGEALEKNRHDDYLAEPAMNGYSAIHDTYKFTEGCIEIAFTTKERENFNNWGVLRLSRQTHSEDPEKFSRKVVFTPKRELVFLEPTARGIDLAYKINPLLGLKAVALRVDGEIRDLSDVVGNASLVEVITDIHQTSPRTEWLSYCNVETRRMIELQKTKSERDGVVERGKEMLAEMVLKERGVLELEDLPEGVLNKLLIDLGCWNGIESLYYKMAFGLDVEIVKKKLTDLGVVMGLYSTVRVKGENEIGVSENLARIIARNGGDVRRRVETVDEQERYEMRVLMIVGYEGKKKIEQEVGESFIEWEIA